MPTNVLSVQYTDEQGQVSEHLIEKKPNLIIFKAMDMVFIFFPVVLLLLIVYRSFMHLLDADASID